MAVAPVSNAAAAGNTVTMSAHSTGNLIVASVWKSGATTPPTIPGGWTAAVTTTGATSWMGVYSKIAASGSETTGTWTGATAVEVNVYSGASGIGGVSAGSTNTGTTITYPAVTLQKTNSTSWVYRTACAKAATNITTNTPTGYTARGGVATTGSAIRGCDSNAGLAASPGTATQTVSGSGVWIALSVEIKQTVPPGAAISTLTDDFNTGSTPNANWSTSAGSASSLSAGELVVPASSALQSVANYNFTGDAAYFQMKTATTSAVFFVEDSTTFAGVGWNFNSSSQVEAYDDGVGGLTGVTRTHTAGDWYRVRESGGTTFWDYSSNGSSWTNLRSAANSFAITNTIVVFGNNGVGSPHFDNFNTAPAVTNTGQFFVMF
jgi:hypothetical protein